MSESNISQGIRQNLSALRLAVEERKYPQVEALLAEQRQLFERLDLQCIEARELFTQAQELNHWALLLTQMQHAHAEQALASVLKIKQLDAGYMPSPVCSAEFVNLRC